MILKQLISITYCIENRSDFQGKEKEEKTSWEVYRLEFLAKCI